MEKLTKVATLALPIAVKAFGFGKYGWEIGPHGLLACDVGCRSFDEAEGAARKAAERLEKEVLERYADAASTITAQTPAPGSIKALVDSAEKALVRLRELDGCWKALGEGDAEPINVSDEVRVLDYFLSKFKGAQEVKPDADSPA